MLVPVAQKQEVASPQHADPSRVCAWASAGGQRRVKKLPIYQKYIYKFARGQVREGSGEGHALIDLPNIDFMAF